MDSADGGGTVMIAELEIDAGAMAPKFLVDRMVKKALDETGNALKKYVKSMPAQQRAPERAAQAGSQDTQSAPRFARHENRGRQPDLVRRADVQGNALTAPWQAPLGPGSTPLKTELLQLGCDSTL
jgi:hypothetical protein